MITKDRIRGVFLGLSLGDAIGKPVEMKKPDYIKENYGRVDRYLDCSGHKYFDGDKQGTWTDDCQLSLAVARSYIKSNGFNIHSIVNEHIDEFKKSVRGWGGSTREAIAKVIDGVPWDQASVTDNPKLGVGNGVAMKVAPIGMHMALTGAEVRDVIENITNIAILTHRTSMAVTSGLAQTFAVYQCLRVTPTMPFLPDFFLTNIAAAGMLGRKVLSETLTNDDIANRFDLLSRYKEMTTDDIIEQFGGGSCYVYDSLPFTYAFFLKNPNSIDCLYDCISAGGDTDTNGSMIGALLGALHGTSIFPENLVNGLDQKDMILDVADQFYDKFGAKS